MVVCNNLKRYDFSQYHKNFKINEIKVTGNKYPETLIFTDKHLEVLGVTDRYIEYFYHEYLTNAMKIEQEIININNGQPKIKKYKHISYFVAEANFWRFQLYEIYDSADKKINKTELVWKHSIYGWMGARSYVKDAPEIQCFKKYPEIPFGAGKSFLYYCDKPQYLKYCEKYDKDEESRKAYAKYIKDHIHEIFF